METPTNNVPPSAIIKALLHNKQYLRLIPYVILFYMGCYAYSVAGAAWAASWLGGCTSWNSQQKDDINNCHYRYAEYNFYNCLTLTGQGTVSFLFSGYIGRLSDAYGRFPFILLLGLCRLIPLIPNCFIDNFWIYIALNPMCGLSGSMNSASPIFISYISDCVPSAHRTIAYGFTYFLGSVGVIITSITALLLVSLLGVQWIFPYNACIFLVLLVYALAFIKESLAKHDRKQFNNNGCYNPFSPLSQLRAHPIVFWISIMSVFLSLPETGILDIAATISLDILHINNADNATLFSVFYNGSAAIGNVISNLILLPILSKYMSDMQLVILGCLSMLIAFITFGLLPYFKYQFVSFISAFFLTFGMIAFPAANSILTRSLHKSERGIGVGIVYGMRGITFMIAPIGFASLYNLCKHYNFESGVAILAFAMIMIALIIVFGPLKKAIMQHKGKENQLFYSKVNLLLFDESSKSLQFDQCTSPATASFISNQQNLP